MPQFLPKYKKDQGSASDKKKNSSQKATPRPSVADKHQPLTLKSITAKRVSAKGVHQANKNLEESKKPAHSKSKVEGAAKTASHQVKNRTVSLRTKQKEIWKKASFLQRIGLFFEALPTFFVEDKKREQEGKYTLPLWSDLLQAEKARRNIAIALIVVLSLIFLYPSAQTLYIANREQAQLEVELAAVQERNEAIESQVKRLESPEGVEDLAHTEFGWVKKGEHAVNVYGADDIRGLDVHSEVLPEEVSAPQTWYSPILDPFFGFDPNAPVNPS